MKVCDRHHDKRAVDTIHVKGDDQLIDVCDECKYEVMELLTSPINLSKQRGRPPKNFAEAN